MARGGRGQDASDGNALGGAACLRARAGALFAQTERPCLSIAGSTGNTSHGQRQTLEEVRRLSDKIDASDEAPSTRELREGDHQPLSVGMSTPSAPCWRGGSPGQASSADTAVPWT